MFLESRSVKFIARSRYRLVVDIWYARQVSVFTSTYLDGIHLLTSRRRWFCITSILIHHNTRITRPDNLSGLRPDDSGERTTPQTMMSSHSISDLSPTSFLLHPFVGINKGDDGNRLTSVEWGGGDSEANG